MPVQLPIKNERQIKDVAPTAGNAAPSTMLDSLPIPIVLWLAAPYLAGKTAEDALKKAHEVFRQNRFTSTIDILGEDIANASDCDAFVEQYKGVIDLVASSPLPVQRAADQMTISFKPSMFSTVTPGTNAPNANAELDHAFNRIKSIVDYGKKKNVNLTLEAEDHRWADFQLDTYFKLVDAGYTNLGTVLQSRLFRTKNDVRRFDERHRVRMVIGIYNEAAEIAYTDKPVMKEVLVDLAAELAARGSYIEIATHDGDCMRKFIERVAIPQKLPSTRFEYQNLLGVPRKELQQALVSGKYFAELGATAGGADMEYLSDLARTGIPVRMYLPFGKDAVAGPYCKRRLKANPNMVAYGIKNFFHIQ